MANYHDKESVELKEQVAARINELFEQSKQIKKDFAYEMGMDPQNFSRLLNQGTISLHIIKKVCGAAGIGLKEFFDSSFFK